MTRALRNTLCRLLIALTAWAPYQMANASLIGTEQAVSSTAQADRALVLSVLERSEVASALQAYGIDAAQAKHRVQAMSDEEVGALAQRIDSAPAGALHGAGSVLVLALIAVLLWYLYTSTTMRR